MLNMYSKKASWYREDKAEKSIKNSPKILWRHYEYLSYPFN